MGTTVYQGLPQAQNIWNKVDANQKDIKILVVTDSTGSGQSNWPYTMAGWLGEQAPTHDVKFTPIRLSEFDDTYGQSLTPRVIYTTTNPDDSWVTGETVTGGTSGATGTYAGRTARGVYLTNVTGVFEDGETITGATASQTVSRNDAGYLGWQDTEDISTGTGDKTIYVDNMSGSGKGINIVDGHFGDFLTRKGFIYDLIIISHGHNVYVDNQEQYITTFAHSISLLKRKYPMAQVMLTKQNLRYDGTDATDDVGDPAPSGSSTVAENQAKSYQLGTAIDDVAAIFGCGVIDILTGWDAAGGKTLMSWTPGGNPGLHPDTDGKAYWLSELKKSLARNTVINREPTPLIPAQHNTTNLAPNPIFNYWTAGAPDGWEVTGTVTQDDVHYETGRNSVKLDPNASISLNLREYSQFLRGQYVTVAARAYLPLDAASSSAGGYTLSSRGDGVASQTSTAPGEQATQATQVSGSGLSGWRWVVTSIYVHPNDNYLIVDPITNSTEPVWIDRVVVTPGIISGEVDDVDFLDADILSGGSLWSYANLSLDRTSGYGNSITEPAWLQAMAIVDENGSIELWQGIPDSSNMIRKDDGDNPGTRFSLELPRLTVGVTYTVTWNATTSSVNPTISHKDAAGSTQGSVTNGGTFVYAEGDYLFCFYSVSNDLGVVHIDEFTISPP